MKKNFLTFFVEAKISKFYFLNRKDYGSLDALCKCWLEPALKTRRGLLPFLWKDSTDDQPLLRSHLWRMSQKYGIEIDANMDDEVFLDHRDAFIRLNIFAGYCYSISNPLRSIKAVKHFLHFNATADTTYLRENTYSYFKIFLTNILTIHEEIQLYDFVDWFHEFTTDCFEPGSCYQRKIFGLQLLDTFMRFTSVDCVNPIASKDRNLREAVKIGTTFTEKMKSNKKWKFDDKETLLALLKLTLDPATDVKDLATRVITEFYDLENLTKEDKTVSENFH